MSRLLSLSGEQIRAARALARIEQADLARLSGVSLETVKRLERIRGPVDANSRTLAAINEAFDGLGVLFEDSGVRFGTSPAMTGPLHTWSDRPAPQPARQKLVRAIYCSTLQPKLLPRLKATLDTYAAASPGRAAQLGCTGGMLVGDGQILSLLEGEEAVLQQVVDAAFTDPRIFDLKVISRGTIPARLFLDWRVYCGAFPSDAEVLGDVGLGSNFRPESLTPEAVVELLIFMRDLQQVAPRSLRGCAGACGVAGDCQDQVCVESVRAMTAALPPPPIS